MGETAFELVLDFFGWVVGRIRGRRRRRRGED
jgi:hypothetical protein